jgi:CBS domain-containing protein
MHDQTRKEHAMKLKEIMTSNVEVLHPDDTLQTAARKMRERDIGFLPVVDGDELIGVLTDRDLVMRALATGMQAQAMVGREMLTAPAICVYDDQGVDEATRLMRENQIRRLVYPGARRWSRSGVVSLGDLAINADKTTSGEVLQHISEPA